MKNIVNEKPTYKELESKLKEAGSRFEVALAATLVLAVLFVLSSYYALSKVQDVEHLKTMYQHELKKGKIVPTPQSIKNSFMESELLIQSAKLKERERQLREQEFQFEVRKIKWESQIQVEEERLTLRKERLNLEYQQRKFDAQVNSVGKIVQSVK